MSNPPERDDELCPNCGKSVLTGNNWCRSCGYNKHNITFVGPPLKYPISWTWFFLSFAVVPLAACGGCIFTISQVPNGHSSSEPPAIATAFYIQCISVAAGIIFLIYNGIKGRQ